MTPPPVTDAPEPADCPACGEPLKGRYCHACGQDTRIGPHPLRELIAEGVEEVTDLDGKMLRTLSALAVQPGRLLEAYRAGASSRFVTPLKLFVVTTALFLAVLGLTDVVLYQYVWKVEDPAQAVSVAEIPLDEEVVLTNARSASLWMQRRVEPPVDAAIYEALGAAATGPFTAAERASARYDIQATREQIAVSQRLADWLPNVLWLLAPLYALMLAPLFGRRRLFAEHLAFAFWGHATIFVLLILLAGINALGAGLSAGLLVVPYLIYFTLAARRYYDQSWAAAALKAVGHTAGYVVLVLMPATMAVVATVVDWTAFWVWVQT